MGIEKSSGDFTQDLKPWPLWLAVSMVAMVSFAIVGVCVVRFPDFFFIDDNQNYLFPFYREMGRLWLSGHLPILTTKTLFGGDILTDMVLSPFAPQTIFASIFSVLTPGVRRIADTLAFINTFLVVGAAYWIGRIMGVRSSLSLLLGASIATTPVFLCIYQPSSYVSASAFAWMAVAIAALLQLKLRTRAGIFLLAVFSACCLLASAATQQQVFYVVFALVVVMYDFYKSRDIRKLAILCMVGICALLIAALPLMTEYVLNAKHFNRAIGFNNYGNAFAPNWGFLINFFNPLYGSFMSWGGYRFIPLSLAYAGIVSFVPLLFMRPLPVRAIHSVKESSVQAQQIFLIGLVTAIVLSFLPSQFGPMRWSFRFLPDAVFCLSILTFYWLDTWVWRNDVKSQMHWAIGLGLAFGLIQLFSADDVVFSYNRLTDLLVFWILLGMCIFSATRVGNLRIFILWFASAGAFVAMVFHYPATGIGNLRYPALNWEILRDLGPEVDKGFELSLIGSLDKVKDSTDMFGAQALATGVARINGYSAVGHKGFESIFPHTSANGFFFPRETLLNITKKVDLPSGGRDIPVYRLFNIRKIYAWARDITPEIAQRLDQVGLIKRTLLPDGKLVVEPDASPLAQGTLSYGAGVEHVRDDGPRSEWFEVSSSGQARQLVFSRVTWPGYHAELNGQPLPVGNWENALVALELPAGSSGSLHVYYEPVSWRYTRWGLVAGCCLLGFVMYRFRRRPIA
jgi:hypothetical protein